MMTQPFDYSHISIWLWNEFTKTNGCCKTEWLMALAVAEAVPTSDTLRADQSPIQYWLTAKLLT